MERVVGSSIVEVHLPEEPGTPHGHLMFHDAAAGVNFITHPWRGTDSLREFGARLAEFLAGDEPWLEFESPHDGRTHLLSREAARRVMVIAHTRSEGQVAPHARDARTRLVRASEVPLL